MLDGPVCHIWTHQDVRRWLVAAFIALPTTPIYSKPNGSFGAVSGRVPDATFDWIRFLNQTIESRAVRLSLLIWAKREAKREAKKRKLKIEIYCAPISEFCREHGWPRSSFEWRVNKGFDLLARERSLLDAAVYDFQIAA